MKRNITLFLSLMVLMAFGQLKAQSVYPGKKNINKTEYLGLLLNQSISEKQLTEYWTEYLSKFGKAKEKRGVVTVEKASIPQISANPVTILSEVSSPTKGQSQVFLALKVDGQYIQQYSGANYTSTESILKDFADKAAVMNEVQVADDAFSETEKKHKKLIKDGEDLTKDIEKAEKKLAELREELNKNRSEIEMSLTDLQNKQKALELQKSRLPK
ncbi:hypothetical protein CLV98_10454 [Dyadobacter jejuensis]|uniref:DUF4468 domain-containing protein n=2 Tax=Dyadobacter jejuensis TaxID=1082580 RepID=A0A316AKP5_9BACT|nr:hypothetical protein CLV98_10454 [Dyadobacter jejuensis]